MYCILFSSNFNGDISLWDISNVTDMSYMFYHSKFKGDIIGWDVSNLRYMSCMFDNCRIKEEYKPKI